jgi:cytochrome c oxidase subunit 2
MVIPGQITRVTQTFDEPGEYKFVCHEFCGLANEQVGHHSMFGRVVVE